MVGIAGGYKAVCLRRGAFTGQRWEQVVGNAKAFSKLPEDPLIQAEVSLGQQASIQHLTTH